MTAYIIAITLQTPDGRGDIETFEIEAENENEARIKAHEKGREYEQFDGILYIREKSEVRA